MTTMSSEDPFEAARQLQQQQKKKKLAESVSPPNDREVSSTVRERHPKGKGGASERPHLIGVYVDDELKALINSIVVRALLDHNMKFSDSVICYWLLRRGAKGMQALREGDPVPNELLHLGRRAS